jgi:hypothetical protein
VYLPYFLSIADKSCKTIGLLKSSPELEVLLL